MVLDISSLSVNSLSSLLRLNALELGHDDFHRLPDYVGECIESASMGHSNDKGSGALLDCGVDAEFEAWDESFAAFEAKSFHSIKFASHECAPLMRPVQAPVHVNFFTFGLLTELNRFELLTNPSANLTVLDMHELNGYFVAVSITICADQLTEDPFSFPLYDSAAEGHLDVELTVHIRLSEAVVGWVEQVKEVVIGETELFGQTWAVFVVFLEVEWVDVRDKVTVSHESSQQHLHANQLICRSRV